MTEANLSNSQTSPMRSAAGVRTNGWARVRQILRRLLVSEYFVLYLSILFSWCSGPSSRGSPPPRISVIFFSNMWPLLAVAIGQTFVLIVAGIDLSQIGDHRARQRDRCSDYDDAVGPRFV